VTFLKSELPIRIAHMCKEIQSLPPVLLEMPSVQRVYTEYLKSFEELVTTQNQFEETQQCVDDFTNLIQRILTRHQHVVASMASGMMKLRASSKYNTNLDLPIQYFLDRLYMSRIAARTLIANHIELFGHDKESIGVKKGNGGLFEPVDILEIAKDAGEHARSLCFEKYLTAPKINVCSPLHQKDCTITYIPSHVYHILFELLKNSLRAVVEHH